MQVTEAILTKKTFLCNQSFEKSVIAITTALPKFTIEGSVDPKFFEEAVYICIKYFMQF